MIEVLVDNAEQFKEFCEKNKPFVLGLRRLTSRVMQGQTHTYRSVFSQDG